MVGIKDFEMPAGCWYSTKLKISGVTTCPLKSYCSAKHIKEASLDTRPDDCPLVESIQKANVYKAIQEMMKYEHEGFIDISLSRLDEILKKCGVEDGNDD